MSIIRKLVRVATGVTVIRCVMLVAALAPTTLAVAQSGEKPRSFFDPKNLSDPDFFDAKKYFDPEKVRERAEARQRELDRVKENAAATPPVAAKDADAVPLHEAIRRQLVAVEITGMNVASGDAIEIHIQRRVKKPVTVSLPPGTIFRCTSPFIQDMAGLRIKGERIQAASGPFRQTSANYRPTALMALTDDDEHTYVVEAYCLDIDKGNPGRTDSFDVDPPDEGIARLLAAGRDTGKPIRIVQCALWIARNPADVTKLKSKFPVNDYDIREALSLLEQVLQGKPAAKVPPRSKGNTVATPPDAEFRPGSFLDKFRPPAGAAKPGDKSNAKPAAKPADKFAPKPEEKPANGARVPGFGDSSVPGFGQPGNDKSNPRTTGSSSGPPRSKDDDPLRRFAESLLTQYDTNKNGKLDRDEWTKIRGGMDGADKNSDGVITLDELLQKISAR